MHYIMLLYEILLIKIIKPLQGGRWENGDALFLGKWEITFLEAQIIIGGGWVGGSSRELLL